MYFLSLNELRKMIKSAYMAGYNGNLELTDSYAEEILENNCIQDLKTNYCWEKFDYSELRKFPIGTTFEHVSKGFCKIIIYESNKCMEFCNGEIRTFCNDGDPWNDFMKILEIPKDDCAIVIRVDE